jgi:hypothetical protein
MIEEFLSNRKNHHRLAPMFLIGIFTDEDSSLGLVAGADLNLRPSSFELDEQCHMESVVCPDPSMK